MLFLFVLVLCIIFTYFYMILNQTVEINDARLNVYTTGQKNVSCEKEEVFCTSNTQCNKICNTTKFVCNEISQKCTPLTILESIPNGVECQQEKGFLWTVVGSEVEGFEWECISTKPNIYDSKGEKHPHVCGGNGIYQSSGVCTCSDDRKIGYRIGDVSTPRCIPNFILKLFPHYEESFSSN